MFYLEQLGVDLAIVKGRIEEVLRILGNFKQERDPEHSRQDYISLLVNDFAYYYGYNEFLIRKFLQVPNITIIVLANVCLSFHLYL